MSIVNIIQGDSSDIYEIRVKDENGAFYDISDMDWVGTLVVRKTLGAGATEISRSMPKSNDGKRFLGQIQPSESNVLTIGNYFLILEVENLSLVIPFRKEDQIRINITEQGVSP